MKNEAEKAIWTWWLVWTVEALIAALVTGNVTLTAGLGGVGFLPVLVNYINEVARWHE